MTINSIHTIDLTLNLIPNLTLLALHTDQGIRLIAQNKFASFFVINSRTDELFTLDGEEFVRYMQFLGVEEMKVLFQKKITSNKGD